MSASRNAEELVVLGEDDRQDDARQVLVLARHDDASEDDDADGTEDDASGDTEALQARGLQLLAQRRVDPSTSARVSAGASSAYIRSRSRRSAYQATSPT